jgi:hypothetical protein
MRIAVMDSERQRVHRRADTMQRSIERTRAITKQAEERKRAAVAADGDIPTDSLEAQIGRPMAWPEIQKRLETLSPRLYFEVSKADDRYMGIYLKDPTFIPADPKYKGLRFLFGAERGISPEFSVRHSNDEGEFTGETRGWWTTIKRLCDMKVIDPARAIKAFGRPLQSRQNWQNAFGGFGC